MVVYVPLKLSEAQLLTVSYLSGPVLQELTKMPNQFKCPQCFQKLFGTYKFLVQI